MMTIIYYMSIKYFMNIGLIHTAFPLNRNFHNHLFAVFGRRKIILSLVPVSIWRGWGKGWGQPDSTALSNLSSQMCYFSLGD